ncbi:adhesion G protein-coupled receptor E2-like [Pundamilia nyererei]|uniref:Adhesion G protein-coupled receptor E2-like n=1 Tax=Pundamilia nyererei TaxID=303518 RepID=A0A9Y6JDW4_9CICH|nr:PREDICTED: adhesion G protein-coupled receptor E2-like [Pundamilia nyererei]
MPPDDPPTSTSYGCIDINECTRTKGICGYNTNCYNTVGSYSYIDECLSGVCGPYGTCYNTIGSFVCNCSKGFRADYKMFPICQDVDECYNSTICGPYSICENLPGNYSCSCKTVANSFAASMAVSGVGPRATQSKVSSEGDRETGNAILDLSEYIVVAMTPHTENQTKKEVHSSTVDLSLLAIGPGSKDNWNTSLSANGNTMDFNLQAIARANNGSATAAFMTLNGMESLLSHQYFQTEKKTDMCSDVITAIIPVNNTNLTEPVNFTIYHRKEVPETGTLACTVMAGLLHFLIVASFVWMLLEALQLHLLVRKLSQVQVIRRDGLPRPILYLVGYGVPFVIVGVSALIYSDGYGVTSSNVCFLSTKRNFNWALTGPIIAVLAINWLLFLATLWSLRPTLANMKSDVSQSKDTRLIIFKIVAQFVILGCTWILGLYQSNLFFQVLFIILNSQQGTFLYIVHCLLNKEVREEYIKWLTCSIGKEAAEEKDVGSVTEDFDKPENQNNEGKKDH